MRNFVNIRNPLADKAIGVSWAKSAAADYPFKLGHPELVIIDKVAFRNPASPKSSSYHILCCLAKIPDCLFDYGQGLILFFAAEGKAQGLRPAVHCGQRLVVA